MERKPRGLIASSVEGLEVANAIQENLERLAEITIWTQDVFQPSSGTIDDLLALVSTMDFGIAVFGPDDVIAIRGESSAAPRDNVVFELGLMMGTLGRLRSYVVRPRGMVLRTPSDLIGVEPVDYDADRSDNNLVAALQPACNRLTRAIRRLELRTPDDATHGSPPVREGIVAGIRLIQKQITSSIGPMGRRQAVRLAFDTEKLVRRGVLIARGAQSRNRPEEIGIDQLRGLAMECDRYCGDFTKTSILIAAELMIRGEAAVSAGATTEQVLAGIRFAVGYAEREISSASIHDPALIGSVAATAAASRTLGRVVVEAFRRAGRAGLITVEYGTDQSAELDASDGVQIDRGYLTPDFLVDPNSTTMELTNCAILLLLGRNWGFKDFLPVAEYVAANRKSLVVIAEDVQSDLLETLLLNNQRGILNSVIVKPPAHGDRRREVMKDIAVLSGGKLVDASSRSQSTRILIESLGHADKVLVGPDRTSLLQLGGDEDQIKRRAELVESQLAASSSDYDREKLQERLAQLAGGRLVTIVVGGVSEDAAEDRLNKVRTAIHSTRNSIDTGVVPGAGLSLLRIAQRLRNESVEPSLLAGISIACSAFEAPARAIIQTREDDDSVVLSQIGGIANGSIGYNVESGDVEDLVNAGVLDPAGSLLRAVEMAHDRARRVLQTDDWSAFMTDAGPVTQLDD